MIYQNSEIMWMCSKIIHWLFFIKSLIFLAVLIFNPLFVIKTNMYARIRWYLCKKNNTGQSQIFVSKPVHNQFNWIFECSKFCLFRLAKICFLRVFTNNEQINFFFVELLYNIFCSDSEYVCVCNFVLFHCGYQFCIRI